MRLRDLFQVVQKAHPVPAARHKVGAQLFHVLRADLRIAAAHRHKRGRVQIPQAAHRLARLAPTFRRDGACIDDVAVARRVVLPDDLVAAAGQHRLQRL